VKNAPWHLFTVKANYWWLSTTKILYYHGNTVNNKSLKRKYSENFRQSLNISG
jgi:hypothetical protein